MQGWLRQSTETTRSIGPFIDPDGVTEETGLAGNATEIRKEGGSFAAGPVLGTHDAEGYYPVTFTTTHTNTPGSLRIKSHDSATHLPVWEDFFVVDANFYDTMMGTDKLQVDTVQVNGTSASPATDYATASNQTTILARLGDITGAGVNTVLGFFKALLSKTASTPSDIGGTFTPTTDSTEAIAENGGGGGGAGGLTVSSQYITVRDSGA